MSELSNLLKNTDFENISLEDLVHLEDSLQQFENTTERNVLESLKQKIADKYKDFCSKGKGDGLRFQVHKIRTGYDVEDWGNGRGNISREDSQKLYKRCGRGWDMNNGWKFHLDVVPNRNHPVTKAVSEFLLDLNVCHKIAAGGNNGKGMTVYVGSYDDVNKLAEVIQERFGKDIYEPPAYTYQKGSEYAFQPTVYGRFVPGKNGNYPWSVEGLGLVYDKYRCYDDVEFPKSLEKAIELGLVENKDSIFDSENILFYIDYGDGSTKQIKEDELLLRTYCCHKLYAEALGDYYCGSNIETFEKKFFGDRLPAKGTEKRQKYDAVADTFVEEAKNISFRGKKFFDFLKDFTNGYQPLDLSRVKMETYSKDEHHQEENNQSLSQRLNNAKKHITEQKKQKEEERKDEQDKKKIILNQLDMPNVLNTQSLDDNQENKGRRVIAQQNTSPTITAPLDVDENKNEYENENDAFKKGWREFATKTASKLNGKMEEDMHAKEFVATIEHPDGTLAIKATSANEVSLGAKDKDDNPTVPDLKVFQELAQKALNENSDINFGNIQSPEFKVRLMIACIEKGVAMQNAPQLDDAFLNSIKPESAKYLRILQNKQKTQQNLPAPQQPNPPAPQPQAKARRQYRGRQS